jgi:hypothetical protein
MVRPLSFCMPLLNSCSGPERYLHDLRQLLEATWAESEAQGGAFVDWHWVKEAKKLPLFYV